MCAAREWVSLKEAPRGTPCFVVPERSFVPRKFISPTQAAEIYGVSRRSIARYITQGLLPAYRIGPRNIRLDADEVERILLGNRVGAK